MNVATNIATQWRGKRLFNGPITSETHAKNRVSKRILFRQISKCPDSAFQDKIFYFYSPALWALIASLLQGGCPTTIFRLVVAVVVNSIKRHTGRAITHIRDK
jgi:hypothetical protein